MTRLAQAGVLLAATAVLAAAIWNTRPPDASAASTAELKTGIALMQPLDCNGRPVTISDGVTEHIVSGTGFLVGSRVLMGVEHMIPSSRGRSAGFAPVSVAAGTASPRSRSGENEGIPTAGEST